MTNGIFESGFDNTKPVTPSTWPTEHYSDNPGSANAASDKSAQDGAGLNNGGK